MTVALPIYLDNHATTRVDPWVVMPMPLFFTAKIDTTNVARTSAELDPTVSRNPRAQTANLFHRRRILEKFASPTKP
jgi:hypothetical protein